MIKLKREAKIGLFAILTLAALYWGVNFLKGRDLFNRNNTYYAQYEQVNGVQTSSSVFIKGLKVGVVTNISYDPAKSDMVVIELSIKPKYTIPENSEARIFSDGVLGGKALEIRLGDSPKLLADGDTLRSVMDKDFLEVAGSEFEGMKQKATVLIDNINQTLDNVNKVLSENAANVNKTIENLADISGSVGEVVKGQQRDLRSIISNISHLSRTLKQNSERIDNIVANVEGFTDSLKRSDIPALVDHLSATLAELDTTINQINSGDGTLGKLLSDDRLYDSLVTASSNLAALLEDVKANPGRYVHISVFGGRNKEK